MRAPTPQQLFNKTVRHLHTQGKQVVNREGECRYRGARGTSCAVGCHIPDELYDRNMEGKNLREIKDDHPEAFKAIVGKDEGGGKRFQLLTSLQNAHDDIHHWPDNRRRARLTVAMVQELLDIAHEYKLSPTILETLGY